MLLSSLGFSQLHLLNKFLELLLGAVLLHLIICVYDQLRKCAVLIYLNYGIVAFLTLYSLALGEGINTVSFNIGSEYFVFDVINLGFYIQVTVALIYSLIGILMGAESGARWKVSVVLNLGVGLFLWFYLFVDALAAEISFFSLKAFSFGILGFTGLWAMLEKGRMEKDQNSESDLFLETFKVPVFLLSNCGRIIGLNSKAKLFFGIKDEDTIPQVVDIVSNFEEKIRFEQECMQILLGIGSPNKPFSFVGKKPGGEMVRVWAHGQVLDLGLGKEGQILLFLEDELTLSYNSKVGDFDEVYQSVLSVSSEAMWQYDVQLDKLYFGKGFKDLFGLDSQEKVNREYILSRIHPEDYERVREKLDQLVLDLDKTAWENEYRFLKEDGEFAQVKSRGYILRDSNGRPVKFLGAMKDVSFVYEYLKKIKTQNSYFREIIQMQSHEVREPLTRIMAVANFILEHGYSELEEKEALRIIANSCQELDKVIHQVIEKVERAQIDTGFIESNK
ncbi:PAS domain-containing protein [Echinicola salinicaeni]|uniref:PAS domain-containing protein n=1 Tax=Echinicola salinicaeni TaxID=2762757 RepID=UPI001646A048|nr:PAS domain-containing protein [Echinicola salinicaeni]